MKKKKGSELVQYMQAGNWPKVKELDIAYMCINERDSPKCIFAGAHVLEV